MGHTDLGEFYFERGDFQNAIKSFVRTRDYCTTSKHIIAMCISVIKVSIHMGTQEAEIRVDTNTDIWVGGLVVSCCV